MDISLDKSAGQYQISSYSDNCITINNIGYFEPVSVSLDTLENGHLPTKVSDFDQSLLKALKIDSYEAVLLGTGEELQQASWDLLESAQIMGAPLEVMSTAAACRTFTVLASEGRRVLAILYP
ncbi:Mth938-like domain-containing protein [Kangiella japonica]|uniref:Mth938-like domain-containing protein n=1 Tax=Kangiella japonica TaxID=647384 RepID=A0ABN0STM7_9GAMM